MPAAPPAPAPVLPGVDVLLRDRPAVLSGRRLGLVTSSTGRTRAGQSTIDAQAWADALRPAEPVAVRFAPADRSPDSSKFAGQSCHGLAIELLDRRQVRPMELGITMLVTARAAAGPGRLQFSGPIFDRLAGTDQVKAIEAGRPAGEIVSGWQSDLERFRAVRERYLVYEHC